MDTQEGAVESPQQEASISDVSTNDLREALGTEQSDEVGMPQPEQEAQAPPEAQEAPEAAQEADRLAKRRIRPRTPRDQQVIDLYRSEGFQGSFAEASQIIYGQENPNLPAAQPQGPVPQQDPFAQSNEQIQMLRSEISNLEDKVKEASDNLDTGEALEHQRDLMRKEMEIQALEQEQRHTLERQRQAEFDAHRNKAVESRDRVLDQFPVLKNEESLERKQFDHFIQQAQGNPDYAAVFDSPRWPELMVKEFVDTIYPETEAPQGPPQQAPTMGTQAKVLTSGTTAPVSAPTQAHAARNVDQMSRDDIYDLLGQPDGRRVLR